MKEVEIKHSDGVVFLLGAGASATHGLPVMSQFLSVARRRFFDRYHGDSEFVIESEPFSKLLQFHHECRSAAWLFNRDWDNIEELYTQADLCRIAGIPDVRVSKSLCESIAWAIWDIYRTDNQTGSELPPVITRIKNAGLAPKIITTNYDVVVERAIGNHPDPADRHEIYYPGFDRPASLFNDSFIPFNEKAGIGERIAATSTDGVPVIKLHGSVNWFTASPDCYAFYDAGLTRYPAATEKEFSSISDPNLRRKTLVDKITESPHFRRDSSNRITPSIVPPMLGKSSDEKVISHQWHAAINVLRRARQVWIIGYSFPPTDAFMSRLLSEGLYPNDDLDFVAIVNLESRELFDSRLRTIFNPATIGSRLHYFQIEGHRLFNALSHVVSWERSSLEAAQRAAREWARDRIKLGLA